MRGRPPRCGEPWGKGGEVLGARRPVGPGFPSPVSRGEGEPIAPALSPRAAAGGGVADRPRASDDGSGACRAIAGEHKLDVCPGSREQSTRVSVSASVLPMNIQD